MADDGQQPPLDNQEEIIVCRDVHKWFGEFHVLKGVTTSVKRGEKVVILGPSGSGKSTFIRTINRLEEHQRGDIIVDGIALTNDIRNIDAIRKDVGMVFQSFNLFSPSHCNAEHHSGAHESQKMAPSSGPPNSRGTP